MSAQFSLLAGLAAAAGASIWALIKWLNYRDEIKSAQAFTQTLRRQEIRAFQEQLGKLESDRIRGTKEYDDALAKYRSKYPRNSGNGDGGPDGGPSAS